MVKKLELFARLYDDLRTAGVLADSMRSRAQSMEAARERLLKIVEQDRDFLDRLSDRVLELRASNLAPAASQELHALKHVFDSLLEMIKTHENERWVP